VTTVQQRRTQRLNRYDELRSQRPASFGNPPGAAFEIVFDRHVQLALADREAAALREKGRPEEYGDMGVVYEDAYFIAVRDTVRFRDGSVRPYIRLLAANAGTGAAIMPVLTDGRVLIARHFRHSLRTWQWEIPRGFGEPDDDGATTAARELREEIGVGVGKVELLGRVAAEGAYDEIYLARLDAAALPKALTTGAVEEGLDEVRPVTPAKLAEMISGGEITDEYLLAAYAFATARRLL
jgi:ADP-ribose pyrophosphatase